MLQALAVAELRFRFKVIGYDYKSFPLVREAFVVLKSYFFASSMDRPNQTGVLLPKPEA